MDGRTEQSTISFTSAEIGGSHSWKTKTIILEVLSSSPVPITAKPSDSIQYHRGITLIS